MDLISLIGFFKTLFTESIDAVGVGLALIGLIAVGAGLWDIYNHFKPENRDNPGEKSRAVSGLVKFIVGALLATGGYQSLATSSFGEDGKAGDYGAVDAPHKALEVVAETSEGSKLWIDGGAVVVSSQGHGYA